MIWIWLYVFVLGTVIGSFLNVCIIRYQNQESVIHGRSHCMSCGHQLAWYDLVPIVSWLLLKGRCRYCHAPIARRYPLVEALTGVIFLLVLQKFGWTFDTVIWLVFCSFCIYAALIDADSMILPDRTHIVFLVCGLLLLLLHPERLADALIGAVCISLPLLLIAWLSKGMGYGDVKLMASAGFALGWQQIIFAMILGSVAASIYALAAMRKKTLNRKSEMPLGPFLLGAILLTLLYGQPLIHWYLVSFF